MNVRIKDENGKYIEIPTVVERRKNLTIILNRQAELRLKVPSGISCKDVQEFLLSNRNWILDTISKGRTISNIRSRTELKSGDMQPLFGSYYPIHLLNEGDSIRFGNEFYINRDFRWERRELFRKFYSEALQEYISGKIGNYSEKMGCHYKDFTVVKSLSKWGSCDHENRLEFSFLLAMCRPEAINYIIVHELVHTKIKSHGKRFHEELEKYVNRWREERKYLNGNYLIFRAYSGY